MGVLKMSVLDGIFAPSRKRLDTGNGQSWFVVLK